jgi:hypothetical protein
MRRKIGTIGVDAGIVWVGDPCYILHRQLPETFGKDWQEFCDNLSEEEYTSFGFRPGDDGLGICVQTAHGDGEYPVYATYNHHGRISKIEVDFEQDEDDND